MACLHILFRIFKRTRVIQVVSSYRVRLHMEEGGRDRHWGRHVHLPWDFGPDLSWGWLLHDFRVTLWLWLWLWLRLLLWLRGCLFWLWLFWRNRLIGGASVLACQLISKVVQLHLDPHDHKERQHQRHNHRRTDVLHHYLGHRVSCHSANADPYKLA